VLVVGIVAIRKHRFSLTVLEVARRIENSSRGYLVATSETKILIRFFGLPSVLALTIMAVHIPLLFFIPNIPLETTSN